MFLNPIKNRIHLKLNPINRTSTNHHTVNDLSYRINKAK